MKAVDLLSRLSGMYNRNLTLEQTAEWITEINKLDFELVNKVIDDLKNNAWYVSKMPTVPEFLKLIKENQQAIKDNEQMESLKTKLQQYEDTIAKINEEEKAKKDLILKEETRKTKRTKIVLKTDS